MKHGYEQTSVEDVRKELIEKGYQMEDLVGKTKKELVGLLIDPSTITTVVEEDILDAAQEIVEEVTEDEDIPQPYDKEWADYLLRLLRPDELFDGRPTCDGLRRLVEQMIGPIAGREVLFLSPPTKDNQFTTTVSLRLSVLVQNKEYGYWNYTDRIEEEDVADAGMLNTDPPFDKYPSSLAVTRAEGRCLRRILKLKTATAEEVSQKADLLQPASATEEWVPSDKMSIEQKNVIDLLARRCNLNAMKFINSGSQYYEAITDVTKETATKMIQYLNNILQNKATPPDGIGNYEEGWAD